MFSVKRSNIVLKQIIEGPLLYTTVVSAAIVRIFISLCVGALIIGAFIVFNAIFVCSQGIPLLVRVPLVYVLFHVDVVTVSAICHIFQDIIEWNRMHARREHDLLCDI